MSGGGANGQNLGNLIVHVDADISGINNSLNAGQQRIRTFTNSARQSTQQIQASTGLFNNMFKNSFRYLMLHAVIVKGVLMSVHGTINSVKAAMNMVESENLFTVSMGNMAASTRDWSNELQRTLGLNAYEVRKNVGVFYNMTTAMGLTSDKAYEVSTSLTELAYDMASFYNLNYKDAFVKLQAGITGEIEPLRRLGIIVNDNTTRAYAYANGIAKVGSVLTENQKVLARYGVIMKTTRTAQGDLARTLSSPANQARLLGVQIQLLSINIGRIFIPIIQSVIPILNSMVASLSNLANTAANFMEMLFGVDYTGYTTGAKDAADAQGVLANSTDKAAKAAKRSVMAFDQLNIMNKQTAGAGVGVGGSATEQNKPKPPASAAKKEGKLDNIINTIVTSPDFKPLLDSLENLKNKLQPLTETMFKGLKWLWDNVLLPIGKWTITKAVPAFLNLLAGALSILNPLLVALKPAFLWLWEHFLLPIAKWTGGVIISVINGLAVALTKIGDWMKEHPTAVRVMTGLILGFFGAWKLVQLLAFIQMSGGIVAAFARITAAIKTATWAKIVDKYETIVLTLMYAKDFVVALGASAAAMIRQTGRWIALTASQIANRIALIASTIATWAMTAAIAAWNLVATIAAGVTTAFGAAVAFLTSPIGLAILAVAAIIAIIVLLVKNWDKVAVVAKKVWDEVVRVWGIAVDWFSGLWTGIREVFSNVGTWFGNVFDTAWTNIKKAFANVMPFFSGVWDSIVSLFKGVGTSIGNAVGNAFKTGVNSILTTIENIINGFIRNINGVINLINKIPGVNLGRISTVNIPRLAKGAVIEPNSPFTAVLGDQSSGKNIETPLDTMITAFKLALKDGDAGGRGGMPETIVLKIGETEFARIALKSIRNYQRQTGEVVLEV